MKKCKKVSISAISFSIESDAAEILSEYLAQLNLTYQDDEAGGEIIEDIEARIAELLLSQTGDAANVITLSQVRYVIDQMGEPSSLDESSDSSGVDSDYSSFSAKSDKVIERRFYRNLDGAKMGGVLNGLAAYMNRDVAIVRLVYVLIVSILLFSGMGVTWLISCVLYFAMWAFTPAAKTASQKLQMRGKRVTASSLESSLRSEFSQVTSNRDKSERSASMAVDLLYGFGRVVRFAVVAFVAVFGVGVAMALLGSILLMSTIYTVVWPLLVTVLSQPMLTSIALIVSVVTPLLIILYIIIKMLVGFRFKLYLIIPMVVLFIISISTLAYNVGRDVLPNIADRASVEERLTLQTDTLYIEPAPGVYLGRDDSFIDMVYEGSVLSVVDVDFNDSVDSLFKILIAKESSGKSYHDALKSAEGLPLTCYLEGDTLYIDPNIDMTKMDGFRNFDCDLTIYIPEGGVVKVSDKLRGYDINDEYRDFVPNASDLISYLDEYRGPDKDYVREVKRALHQALRDKSASESIVGSSAISVDISRQSDGGRDSVNISLDGDQLTITEGDTIISFTK